MALCGIEHDLQVCRLHAIRAHDELHDRVAQHLLEQGLRTRMSVLALRRIGPIRLDSRPAERQPAMTGRRACAKWLIEERIS